MCYTGYMRIQTLSHSCKCLIFPSLDHSLKNCVYYPVSWEITTVKTCAFDAFSWRTPRSRACGVCPWRHTACRAMQAHPVAPVWKIQVISQERNRAGSSPLPFLSPVTAIGSAWWILFFAPRSWVIWVIIPSVSQIITIAFLLSEFNRRLKCRVFKGASHKTTYLKVYSADMLHDCNHWTETILNKLRFLVSCAILMKIYWCLNVSKPVSLICTVCFEH